MANHDFKNSKLTELARKIARARKEPKPVPAADYAALIEMLRQYKGSEESLKDVLAGIIKKSMDDAPQKMMLAQPLADHIDRNNAKQKYIAKVKQAEMPVRYYGADREMKELTAKTKHPLHYTFLDVEDKPVLYAFNDYNAMASAMEADKTAKLVNNEIRRLMGISAGNISQLYPKESWGQDSRGNPIFYPGGSNGTGHAAEQRLPDAPQPSPNARFFEHIHYGGEVLELAPGYAYQNLVNKWMHQFLFFMTDDWNDNISSVKSGDGTVIMFEHINGNGATLTLVGKPPVPHTIELVSSYGVSYKHIDYWIENRREWPRLDLAGWNDRISSIYHYK